MGTAPKPPKAEAQLPGVALGDVVLDRYRVVEQIASGGHSVVFKGQDERLSRPVCIKVFSGLGGKSGVGRTSYEHFVQEAFALSRLTHPNTLRIYDFGHLGPKDAEGMPLQVCEFMNGGTLSQVIREHGTQTIGETVRIVGAMCAALSEAHALGIVHRDIKPQNILFGAVGTTKLPKLADFGIAKWSDDNQETGKRAEDTAIVAGQKLAMYSPSWAAPEQLAGQPVNATTDIYSLACVAVYMLSGKAIFADEDVYAGYRKRRRADDLVREALAPYSLQPSMVSVLAKALAFDPKKRILQVDAFAQDLAVALDPPPELATERLQRLPPAGADLTSPIEPMTPSAPHAAIPTAPAQRPTVRAIPAQPAPLPPPPVPNRARPTAPPAPPPTAQPPPAPRPVEYPQVSRAALGLEDDRPAQPPPAPEPPPPALAYPQVSRADLDFDALGSANVRTPGEAAAAPHGAAPPYGNVPHGTASHGTAPHGSAPHGSAPPYGNVPHGTAPHGTAPHGSVPSTVAPHGAAPSAAGPSSGSMPVAAPAGYSPPVGAPTPNAPGYMPVGRGPWMLHAQAPQDGPRRLPLHDLPQLVGDRRAHFVHAGGPVDLVGGQGSKVRVTFLQAPNGARALHLKGMTCFVALLGGRPSPAVQIDRDSDIALVTPRAQEIGHIRVATGAPSHGQVVFAVGREAVAIGLDDCQDPILFDFGPGSEAYFVYTRGRPIPKSPRR